MPDSPLRSMTGFGRGSAEAGGTRATVEVRTVNGRFAEANVRSPRILNPHEADESLQKLTDEMGA
ncbi:MAG: hypothetical protein HKN04_13660, partial [Rhodothermaceae bacterium]|nr:hypothetical protein [Rhodothermaceae bacterium]